MKANESMVYLGQIWVKSHFDLQFHFNKKRIQGLLEEEHGKIKDQFCIGEAAYHQLSMMPAGEKLPWSYLIKQFFVHIFMRVKLTLVLFFNRRQFLRKPWISLWKTLHAAWINIEKYQAYTDANLTQPSNLIAHTIPPIFSIDNWN